MSITEDLSKLAGEEIEDIERLTMRWVFQAVCDFGMDAYDIFLNSPDDEKDVAEDITRELLDRLPGYNIPQRVFGTVDYKRARYIILPERVVRQALFIDSKAEKDSRTATIQMSQTSMVVRQFRGGDEVEESGTLPPVSTYGGHQYLTTTVLIHFAYGEAGGRNALWRAAICCIPSGRLQDQYNPNAANTIWLAGRNAPTRGEVFRVRLSFAALSAVCPWRVQYVYYDQEAKSISAAWKE